jgi:hypothetical protein
LLGVDRAGDRGRNGGSDQGHAKLLCGGWHVNLFKVEMDRHCPPDFSPLVGNGEIFLICMHHFDMHAY